MTTSSPLRVLVADDHPYMRAGISGDVNAQRDMLVVAEARDGIETLELFHKFRPDVSLVGLRMPKLDGIEVVASIAAFHPATRAIVLATSSGDVHALRALRAGASGYLLKHMLERDLIDTIRSVNRGQLRIPDEVARQLAEHATDIELTIREIEVLKEISKGRSNKVIGAELDISEHTVKGHTKRILAKLGANDRTHAVMIALQRGFLQCEDTWATGQQPSRCQICDESRRQRDFAQRTSIQFSSQIADSRDLADLIAAEN
jgi:DNA-binding NarL/FixJ family response regulator